MKFYNGKATKKVFTTIARPAKLNEVIVTIIDGEKETQNTANDGDWVITGTKNEQYIISDAKLHERYTVEVNDMDNDNPDHYKITSKPVVIEVRECPLEFGFTASWGEEMIAHPHDFLVYEDGVRSYRIEREAFFNTYELTE